jgi:hypothetical protein
MNASVFEVYGLMQLVIWAMNIIEWSTIVNEYKTKDVNENQL